MLTNPAPTSHAQAPRPAAVMFILGTVLLDVLALGMIIPVLPKIVIGMVGGDSHQAAKIFGLFGFSWALMQFLFSPILGALSDRFGRRPIILFSNFALGLNYILMALAPDLISLFITRLFSGIAAASITTAGAYIADVTKAEDRAAAFGKIGMAFSFAFILGPAVSGLLGADDPRFPFWVAAALSLLNGLYGWFVLPESLALSQRAPFRWRNAHTLGAFKFLRQHPALLGLAAIFFLNSLAHEVMPATFVLYADYRYHWDIRTISLALAVFGIFGTVVQVFFISAATFAVMSLYGYTTQRDLTALGGFLFMGLIGIVIAGLVNIFLQSSMLQFVTSAIGVLVFTGLTAYDTQKIKENYAENWSADSREKLAIMGALTLYLDLINIFLMLLQLLGNRRD